MNVVITGASRGFGRSIAEQFGAAGYDLFLCSRDEQRLEAAVKSLQTKFPSIRVQGNAADLADKNGINSFSEWVLNLITGVHVLVNNAGSFLPGNVRDEKEGLLENMMAVNLYSAYHLTRRLLPAMMKQRSGHIFNMCSIASLNAYANGGAYSISKFALAGFSKNLREELKQFGIKVTTVYPGAAYTDSWSGSGIDPKRIMEASDIAKMIFAASQLSSSACVEDIILRPQLGDL
ncbi:MAG TPA: SDR family oxidoreductase [Flavitalea sp.]|nr:SDR family oxidoreductase [Flavitalea sp.]